MVAAQRGTWVLSGATVVAVASLYLPCVQKAVPGGDSGELITAACELGVAHPPGYPLFTLLSRLAMTFLPSLSPAHSVNLLCCLLGSVSSGTLCFAVCRLTGPGPGAVLAGGTFALSALTWRWSVVAEVFSLNNLFVGLIFALAACFHVAESAAERRKFSHWGALCCGLGLCNQHTLVLYVVLIIPWVLLQLHNCQELTLRGVALLALCFFSGFSPYIYLPVSSWLNTARWSWGDQTTVEGLLTHLLRIEYGTFSLVLSLFFPHAHMHTHTLDLVEDFGSSVPQRQCVLPWLLAAMMLLYSLFFAWRANLDISKPLLLGVVERFWLQSDAVLCVLSGLGLAGLLAVLEQSLPRGALWSTCGWALTAGLLAHLAHSNYSECDQSQNDVVEQFARGVLDSIPQDSLLLTRGDLPGNTLRYLHYCQRMRPDLHLIDQEMMTYSWYVAKLARHHPGVYFPGRWWDPAHVHDKKTFNLEQFLQHNSKRDVFACIGLPEGDPSWERSFSRWPWGICDQLVSAQTRFQPEVWAQHTRNLYNWTEPYDSFLPGSWEKVANEEMWQSRMKTAFFLFDLAEKVPEEAKRHLFELSYTLYKEIVDAHENHPSNWDKNLALAGERLLRYGGGEYSPDSLLTQTIKSFSLYLEKEPADPQAEAIHSVIAHLHKERQRLRHSTHRQRPS
ncbi:transmembrane protein 260 [Arapaima gigas]